MLRADVADDSAAHLTDTAFAVTRTARTMRTTSVGALYTTLTNTFLPIGHPANHSFRRRAYLRPERMVGRLGGNLLQVS
jgi:hypothetical protein